MEKKRIFINPGHCAEWVNGRMIDSGAVNKNWGVTEAEIVLEIGNILKEKLEAKEYEVKLEQSDNIKGEDSQAWRDSICAHANEWMGEDGIVISLHANAFDGTGRAHGTEVYYGSDEGAELCNYIQDELVDTLHTLDRGIKEKEYWIIKYTESICALVEIAYIENDSDCRLLIYNKEEIADAIVRAVEKYLS